MQNPIKTNVKVKNNIDAIIHFLNVGFVEIISGIKINKIILIIVFIILGSSGDNKEHNVPRKLLKIIFHFFELFFITLSTNKSNKEFITILSIKANSTYITNFTPELSL